jgi:hypothetical protein
MKHVQQDIKVDFVIDVAKGMGEKRLIPVCHAHPKRATQL